MVGCPVKLDTPPHAAGLKTPGSQWSRDPSSLPHPLGGGFATGALEIPIASYPSQRCRICPPTVTPDPSNARSRSAPHSSAHPYPSPGGPLPLHRPDPQGLGQGFGIEARIRG